MRNLTTFGTVSAVILAAFCTPTDAQQKVVGTGGVTGVHYAAGGA